MASDIPSETEPVREALTAVDVAAWVEAHADALFRYARGRVGSSHEAEDLVQETFIAALRGLGRFEGRCSARTWLIGILRRKILDRYRQNQARDKLEREASPAGCPPRWFDDQGIWIEAPARWAAPDLVLEGEELREVLDGCLDQLPAHLADVFLLREGDGLSASEICEALNLSAANLRVRLHRARLLLRDCLETKWFRKADDPSGRSKAT